MNGSPQRRSTRRRSIESPSCNKPDSAERGRSVMFVRRKNESFFSLRRLARAQQGQRESFHFYQRRQSQEKQSWETVKNLILSEVSSTPTEDDTIKKISSHSRTSCETAASELEENMRDADLSLFLSRQVQAMHGVQEQKRDYLSGPSSLLSSTSSKTRSKSSQTSRPGHEEETAVGESRPSKPRRVVCQCCYQDISQPAVRSLVCSTEQHSFCIDCVRKYVEMWVFGGAFYTTRDAGEAVVALPCLDGTCMDGYFSAETVSKAVRAKVAEQYHDKLVRMEDIGSDVWQYSSNDTKDVHATKTALLAEKSLSSIDLLEQGYHQAEEALTNAKLRQCPLCKTSFLKEADSCNKMTCPLCRRFTCYICREAVKGYEHFCRHSSDSCDKCNKCPLWTKEDDARDLKYLRQVAEAHANRLWGDSLLHSEHEIRLDIDRLLSEERFCSDESNQCRF